MLTVGYGCGPRGGEVARAWAERALDLPRPSPPQADRVLREHLEGELAAEMAAGAKLYTSEVEGRAVDECLQLHGEAGYMDEYEISRLYADARISRIYAGTSEIMREIIGRGLGLDERRRN